MTEPIKSFNAILVGERRIELAMAAELAALYNAAPDSLRQSLGLQHTVRDGATLVRAAHVPNFHFNRVTGFGITAPASASNFADIQSFYESLQTQFALSISPSVSSTTVLELLHRNQFTPLHHTAILTHIRASVPDSTTPFTIQRIGLQQAQTFSKTLVEAFDLPPFMVDWMSATVSQPHWHHYLAYNETDAIATGTLYVKEQVGHFGWAATLPKYRGQGAHSALIAQRIRDAQALGCDVIVADTNGDSLGRDNASFNNLRRLGFDLLYVRSEYLSPAL